MSARDATQTLLLAGGSMSNIMGLALARYKLNNRVVSEGLFNSKRMVVFTSEEVWRQLVLAIRSNDHL